MKRKVISVVLMLTLITSMVLMNGCSKKEAAQTEPVASESTAVEPLKVKFSSTFQESETGGQIIKHFIEKVGELSDGAITVDIAWGGTLFTAPDELDAVADGSVNMVALGHMPHLNSLNYLAFPSFAPGGTKEALNYFQTLVFDDPETSALIQGEAEEMGIKYLNVLAGGANAFCAKYEFTDLNSLVSKSTTFGNMDAPIFETLGFKVNSLFPPDIYDALNRGLVDSTQMALAPMVAMSWYEPAPYWALDGTYTAGNFFTVNLEWWNGLSEAQQAIITEASKETQTYTESLYDEAIAKDIATVEEKTGHKFVALSSEDVDKVWAAIFDSKAKAALELASKSNKTEGMTKVLEKAAEITGYTWKH